MKIAALLWADLERDFFGAPSTLGEDLAGEPVLKRTVDRLFDVAPLDAVAVGTRPEHAERVRELLGQTPATIVKYEPGGGIGASMRHARAFGKYGWRGGLAGTTIFDELYDPVLAGSVIEQLGADAVMLVPAGAALLDVDWCERILLFYRDRFEEFRISFSQAPPGLAGGVFAADLIGELARTGGYPGRLVAYMPSKPRRDPIGDPYNLTLPDELIATYSRFIADCPRGLWLTRQIVERAGVDVDGATACRLARELGPEPWPREITIELTTRRPIEDDLRPTADRGDLDLATLEAMLAPLAEAGDVNIMFAGAGDALLHPNWPEAVAIAKRVGQVGLATYGTTLDEATTRRLIDSGVDVLQVYVDAVSDDVYAADKRGGSAGEVWANIEAAVKLRDELKAAGPFVTPTMLKTPTSLPEQEAFFRRAMAIVGWGVIVEPTDAAGEHPDRAVVHMAPPTRTPCRRIDARLTLLADGTVCACEEDIHARHGLGGGDLLEAWRGENLASLRRLHADEQWDEHPLCKRCREFHRP